MYYGSFHLKTEESLPAESLCRFKQFFSNPSDWKSPIRTCLTLLRLLHEVACSGVTVWSHPGRLSYGKHESQHHSPTLLQGPGPRAYSPLGERRSLQLTQSPPFTLLSSSARFPRALVSCALYAFL